MVEMVLGQYGAAPLRRSYGALIGMIVRAIQLKTVPAGWRLFEKMPEDFWSR